ncbi:phosphoribosylaminoimidazole-succinocarboxamide synthase [candidate division TA06 bacterium DG_24]|uniref:Phosphoribosylaminoimidazole-succinocarboxamide synthase n=3 Tax=Bacteria division TA06 TaxID=1156500 RepID=A0A0S8JM25_UNCT6|nr:MAG: phosphoribosylaminoimidazole-succinocarboxamide synthase [candidate division TA06 bacterium DG_24]KPK70137.1 MAG: phosphoribosylaminoimidazole-succinocarboxamide synthase [candidate division TA06 bacterium SM23_40]KPL09805.1 MAG: phosphoribosylaminoimidazole-succinocarboxamide synthase [candidate division TA06 bacterium SM1_40]
MTKGERLYEGKAKILYATDDPDLVIQEFKDDATAFNAKKRGQIAGKGRCNNEISTILFRHLESEGVATHFVRRLSEREMLVKKVEIIPIEVTVRNVAAGGISKRLGIAEGVVFAEPVVEYHLKDDALGDPLINDEHIRVLNLAPPSEVELLRSLALEVNRILSAFFLDRGLRLIDFKLEFGRHRDEILLADEISPDTCRLWDAESGERLDKDRFRRDLGQVEEAYLEVLRRASP